MNSKGIINIELIVTLIILLIIFLMFLSISIEEFTSIEETQNRKEARILVDDISDIITKVYQYGEGYSIIYELPPKINKETYVLKINNSGVYVNSHYQITFSKIFLQNILTSEQYYLEAGNIYQFTNINDSVEIKQITSQKNKNN